MPRCKNCKEKFVAKTFLQKFCLKTECITEMRKDLAAKNVKKVNADWKAHVKEVSPKIYAVQYRNELQREINKLARMVDARFNYKCIDCGKDFGNQADAAHYHSRGANSTLRYNLHNLHSAKSSCNQFSDTHKQGYADGIMKRYGWEYMEEINALPLKYPKIKLSEVEVVEKLAVVRKLIRTFDTFQFSSAIQAREQFNHLINIYSK